jgi:predicted MFS family arabinose efflux permease
MTVAPRHDSRLSLDRLVLLLGCGGLISAADNWIVAPLLPQIAAGFGASVASAALVLTSYMIPYGLVQPLHGHLSERFGRLRLLRVLLAGLAISTLACAAAPSLLILCLVRAVTGVFAAGMIAVSLATIGDLAPVETRQAYVGRFMGIVFVGQAASVGLGGLAVEAGGWRVAFVLLGLAAAAVSLALRRVPDPPGHVDPGRFSMALAEAAMHPRGRKLYLLALATGFVLLGIYGFAGAYLQQVGGLSASSASGILTLFGLACFGVGRWLVPVAARLRGHVTVLIGAGAALLAALLLTTSAGWLPAVLAITLLGAGYILLQSTWATLAFGIGGRGLSSGLVGLGLFGGGGLAAWVGGHILALAGYPALWLFWTSASIGLLVLLVVSRQTVEDAAR